MSHLRLKLYSCACHRCIIFFNTNDFDANVDIYTENVYGSLITMRLITTIRMIHISCFLIFDGTSIFILFVFFVDTSQH